MRFLEQILTEDRTAALPALARSADPDTGIYFANAAIHFSVNGTGRATVNASGVLGPASNAFAMLNEESTATNPTVIPHRGAFGTGWGGAINAPALIVASAPALMSNATDTFFYEDDGTTEILRLERDTNFAIFNHTIEVPTGTVSNPAIVFPGSSNTGIYSSGANQFGIVNSGSLRWHWNASGTFMRVVY